MSEHSEIITQDPRMLGIIKLLKRISSYRSHLLVTGESGTGKDLMARAFFQFRGCENENFTKIDCAAIPENLIESELFGHEKGAFSGAVSQRIGRLENANGGTVYFDQISEIPVHLQSKLTRVLQEKTFERLGGNATITIDIQVIASTKEPLEHKIRTGSFREDLYYRLSIVPIHLPPLRKRKSDIPLLTNHFLNKFAVKYHKKKPKISAPALELLCSYSWPGNVRELENTMERLILTSNSHSEIYPKDLPLQESFSDNHSIDHFAEINMTIEELEKIYIQRILKKTRGNKSAAAKILGINRKTLLEKRKRYNLD